MAAGEERDEQPLDYCVLSDDDRVFASDRFSDWMLFKIPELRGRIAYDVRFELYDDPFYNALQDYNFETGTNWKSFAHGYRLVLVDETTQSHTPDFLAVAHRVRQGLRAGHSYDE